MKKILLILVFVVSFLGATDLVKGDSNNTIQTVDTNSTVIKKVENAVIEVKETLIIAASTGDTDSAFQFLLFKMNDFFKNYNLYFNILEFDTAKTVLIFIILISSKFLRFLISRGIEFIFKFYKKESENLVYNLVESVKGYFLWFLIFWSIYWSVKVYFYPEMPGENIKALFNTIHLLTFALLLWNLISNFKVIYVDSKKRTIRIEMVSLIVYTLKIIIIVFVATITFYKFFPGTLAFLGGAGVGLAFLMKDSTSDYVSTVKIVFEKAFSVGDWVKIEGYEGTVDSIDLWNIKIRSFNLSLIVIPTSKVVKGIYENFGRRLARSIKFDFYLPINMNVSKIKLILVDINKMLLNHEGISKKVVLSDDPEENEILKRRQGLSDTIFAHLLDVQHGNRINIYAFTNKDDWGFQRDIQQDIIFKIKEILEEYDCYMTIEAKYLQNPFEEKKNVQENELIEIKNEKEEKWKI